MSVDDLAIDVGLAVDTDEYDAFVACVQNILEYGCKYTQETMDNVTEKCKTSKLDIAKQVIRECRRPAKQVRKAKWWQTYQPRQPPPVARQPPPVEEPERNTVQQREPEQRTPMNLEFKKAPKKMNLEFQKRPPTQYEDVPRWAGREASPPPRRYVRLPPKGRRRQGDIRHQRQNDRRQRRHEPRRRPESRYQRPESRYQRPESRYQRPDSPQRHRKRRRY